jgi:hypothetical protein
MEWAVIIGIALVLGLLGALGEGVILGGFNAWHQFAVAKYSDGSYRLLRRLAYVALALFMLALTVLCLYFSWPSIQWSWNELTR